MRSALFSYNLRSAICCTNMTILDLKGIFSTFSSGRSKMLLPRGELALSLFVSRGVRMVPIFRPH